jgi:hypothetical protein
VIGLQSEMDALPNLGHACGHNLIAITGVAIAIALKTAMLEFEIAGKIILLGTPGAWLSLCCSMIHVLFLSRNSLSPTAAQPKRSVEAKSSSWKGALMMRWTSV